MTDVGNSRKACTAYVFNIFDYWKTFCFTEKQWVWKFITAIQKIEVGIWFLIYRLVDGLVFYTGTLAAHVGKGPKGLYW